MNSLNTLKGAHMAASVQDPNEYAHFTEILGALVISLRNERIPWQDGGTLTGGEIAEYLGDHYDPDTGVIFKLLQEAGVRHNKRRAFRPLKIYQGLENLEEMYRARRGLDKLNLVAPLAPGTTNRVRPD